MKREKFEQVCRASRLAPIHRETFKDSIILVADGWFPDHPGHPGPHYKTLWAVGRNDDGLDVARTLYFDGGVGSSTRDTRLKAALADAREFAGGFHGRHR